MELWRFIWGVWTKRTWLVLIPLILLPVCLLMLLIIYLRPTPPFLDGPPQYILASLTFLISSSQASYIIKFDDRIHDGRIPVRRSWRTATLWTLLLAAFFTLTLAALLAILRIMLSAGCPSGELLPESTNSGMCTWFTWVDPLVVVMTGYGYLLLAGEAWLSWVSPSTLLKLPHPLGANPPDAIIFQYGSNTDTRRLNANDRLNTQARSMGLASTIDPYIFKLGVPSDRHGCTATIERGGEDCVWGVLYKVPEYLVERDTQTPQRWKSLDQIEAEGRNTRRVIIRVRRVDGEELSAISYVGMRTQEGLITTAQYGTFILQGLKSHGAPVEYIEKVREVIIGNNPDIGGAIPEV